MPITDELGRRAASRLESPALANLPNFRADGITFENWLTWLGERQPFLGEAEHLHDRALFAELSEKIAIEVAASQLTAEESGYPLWLGEFVDLLHWSQSHVITLNYDNIVETTLDKSPRSDGDSVVRSADIVTGFPNGRGLMFGSGSYFEERGTLALHKLHGSIDWFSVPGDRTGATLERIPPNETRGTAAHRATIGGREAFIVPPTSTKGTYFDNPKTRFTWQQARDGLREAERVVLIGYSLPLTDTALARLLSMTIAGGQQEVVVVNPDADAVASRLGALGVEPGRVTTMSGSGCVGDFVDAEVDSATKELIRYLATQAESSPLSPVAVGWGYAGWGAITDASFDARVGSLRLTVDRVDLPLAAISDPASAADGPNARHTVTLGALFRYGVPTEIVAQIGDREWRVCTRATPDAAEEEGWVLLRPAGHQPDRRP
ncbi:hypothetical protein [Mycetocola zhujimingii]|uniref:SIR2-like domain-containing protein n=1 Tax=Mycetocola zhujimingii TaxID=2079792 RepID=A0A2U1TCR4_9MICO|nr:hypothetical protein [Mycetocola zhujimingii]PWC06666.1 hypothetical protein DF223_10415 [Mycetocola zhujimingii]